MLNVINSSVAREAHQRVFHVPAGVFAIPILPFNEDGAIRLGLMTQLPTGAEAEVSGPGFNEQTVRIKCGAASYYVFVEQLHLTDVAVA